MVLDADVARVRPRPANRLVVVLTRRHRHALGEVIHLNAVERDDGARTPQLDLHRVPFARRMLRRRGRRADRVDRPGRVPRHAVFELVGGAPVVRGEVLEDLNLVARVDRLPWVGGRLGDADEDAGVVVGRRRAIDETHGAIAELLARVPEQAHPALGLEQAVFNEHAALADVRPARQIPAVEQAHRRGGLLGHDCGGRQQHQRRRQR